MVAEMTSGELRIILGAAKLAAEGASLRLPIESQIRAYAKAALYLDELLARVVAGEADAIGAAKALGVGEAR